MESKHSLGVWPERSTQLIRRECPEAKVIGIELLGESIRPPIRRQTHAITFRKWMINILCCAMVGPVIKKCVEVDGG